MAKKTKAEQKTQLDATIFTNAVKGIKAVFHNTMLTDWIDSLMNEKEPSIEADLDANINKIINLLDPTLLQDAATKNYVDKTVPEIPFIEYYVSSTGNDGTAEAGNKNLPYALVSVASLAAFNDKASTNNNNRVYILAGGAIEDNEINQSGIPIFAEDFAIVWTDQGLRAVISDRTIGDAIIDITGKGTFVHENPDPVLNQQGVNLRNGGTNARIQAKLIDSIQTHGDFRPSVTITDCIILVGLSNSEFFNVDTIYQRCILKYGVIASGTNNPNSNTTLIDCIGICENAYDRVITDQAGNTILTVVLAQLIVDRLIDSHAWRAPVTGTSGGGNVSIVGVNYAITFNTDLETTVDDFVDTHTAALLITADQVIPKRWKEIQLTGTSGTSTITLAGTPYVATFGTDLTTTAADFVTSHSSAIDTQGYRVVQFGSILAFSKKVEAVFTLTVANTTGDLDGTISFQIHLGTVYDNDILVSFANTSGDLDVTFVDHFTEQQLQDRIAASGIANEYGYAAFYLQHSSSENGQGAHWTILNTIFLIRKSKSIGAKIVYRVEEVDGKYGGVIFRNVRVLRDSGNPIETTALVLGKDDTLVRPAEIDLFSFVHNCQTGPITIGASGFSAPVIRSNDKSIANVETGGGSEYLALGTFVPLMPFTTNGDYDPFTLVADIVIDISSLKVGKFRALQIIQSAGQSFEIDLGPNIKRIFGVDPLVEGAFTLLPGTYSFIMIATASTGTLGIHISVEEGQDVIQTPPTLVSLTMSNPNTYADLVISEPVWGNVLATLAVLLANLNITFNANGGTTTAWDETSVKQSDGETEGAASALVGGEGAAGDPIRIFGTITGTPDSLGVLTVTPTDGASIFDQVGNPMDAGESVNDNIVSLGVATLISLTAVDTNTIEALFDGTVVLSDETGFSIEETGQASQTRNIAITGVSGSGTDTIAFTVSTALGVIVAANNATMSYDGLGDANADIFTDQSVILTAIDLIIFNEFLSSGNDTFNFNYNGPSAGWARSQAANNYKLNGDGTAVVNQAVSLRNANIWPNENDYVFGVDYFDDTNVYDNNTTIIKLRFQGPNFEYEFELIKGAGTNNTLLWIVRQDAVIQRNQSSTGHSFASATSFRIRKIGEILLPQLYNAGWQSIANLGQWDMESEVGLGEFDSSLINRIQGDAGLDASASELTWDNLYMYRGNPSAQYPWI